jgi:hypothetical protein
MSLHVTKRFHVYNSPLPSSLGLLSCISDRCLVLLINPMGRFCLLQEDICLMSFSTQPFVRWEFNEGIRTAVFLTFVFTRKGTRTLA